MPTDLGSALECSSYEHSREYLCLDTAGQGVSLIAPGAWVFPSQACTFVYAPTFPSSRYASSRRAGIGWAAEKAVIILLDSPPSAPICCHSSTALDRRPDSGDRE